MAITISKVNINDQFQPKTHDPKLKPETLKLTKHHQNPPKSR